MKKRYLFLPIIFMIISIGLIPLDLFIINVPTWCPVISIILTLITTFLFYSRCHSNKLVKVILTAFTLITVSFTLFGVFCNPYWNSYSFKAYDYTDEYSHQLTYNQAKEDLEYMMKYLSKDHPLFLHSRPTDIQEAYDNALKELNVAKHITVNELNQQAQGIVSLLGDAHTTTYPNYEQPHYLKCKQEMRDKGYQLTEVNGLSLEELFHQKSYLYSFEVESWGLSNLKYDLSTLEGLYFLGYNISEGVTYTYTNSEGDQISDSFHQNDFITYDEYLSYYNMQEEKDSSFVSYKIDQDKSLAVLTLTSCQYNEEYRLSLERMFTEIKKNHIQNVAVDLRGNGGGNSQVADEFIRYLDIDTYKGTTCNWRLGLFKLKNGSNSQSNDKNTDLLYTGNVYLLTSSSTFSSGMMFAEFIKDNKLGTIIGEAPGNAPTGYGDIAIFQLPNSKLCFQVSTKEFFRADISNTEKLVEPDIPCDSDAAMDMLYTTIE